MAILKVELAQDPVPKAREYPPVAQQPLPVFPPPLPAGFPVLFGILAKALAQGARFLAKPFALGLKIDRRGLPAVGGARPGGEHDHPNTDEFFHKQPPWFTHPDGQQPTDGCLEMGKEKKPIKRLGGGWAE